MTCKILGNRGENAEQKRSSCSLRGWTRCTSSAASVDGCHTTDLNAKPREDAEKQTVPPSPPGEISRVQFKRSAQLEQVVRASPGVSWTCYTARSQLLSSGLHQHKNACQPLCAGSRPEHSEFATQGVGEGGGSVFQGGEGGGLSRRRGVRRQTEPRRKVGLDAAVQTES